MKGPNTDSWETPIVTGNTSDFFVTEEYTLIPNGQKLKTIETDIWTIREQHLTIIRNCIFMW